MTAYYFNEGSFDSLDVGVVDSTVHILELEDGSRLFVERGGAREGATAEILARDRTRREGRERTGYSVIRQGESRVAGLEAFDVSAYFREGSDVRYQLRRHVLRNSSSSFVFTMTGPVAAKAQLDARMDRVFETLQFRA